MEMSVKQAVSIFKALGDENRIRILNLLCTGEKCGCHLLEDMHITQPTLSHHMRILCDAGLVEVRKQGKWMNYSVSQSGIKRVKDGLEMISQAHDYAQKDPRPCD